MSKIIFIPILFISLSVLASGLPKPAEKSREASDAERKLINTPVLCDNGEEADANGECKEISKRSVQVVPECMIDCNIPNRPCPPGQEMDENGNCRDAWGRKKRELEENKETLPVEPECIIGCNLPDRCPPGQKPDQNGNCRDDWGLKEEENEKEMEDKEEESNKEENLKSLTRSSRPKKNKSMARKHDKNESSSKAEGKSVKVKVAKAKVAKAKVAKGKTFMLIKKKKKQQKKPTTETPDATTAPPDPPFPFPQPFPQPEFPQPEDAELKGERCQSNEVRDASGECKSAEEVDRRLKTVKSEDTWENWLFDDSDEPLESMEEDYDYEEEDEDKSFEPEEVAGEEPGQIDDELLEEFIKLKLMKLMNMLEMRRRHGPLLGPLLAEHKEEEFQRHNKKRS